MMKKKHFYPLFICFLFFWVPISGQSSLFGSDIEVEMNRIKEYNALQEKNKKYIKDYTLRSAKEAAIKDDEYWDLAFHARFADYGDKDSQFIIAQAYEKGLHTPVNLKKALAFYKKAAENGHLEAAVKTGHIYLEEKWVQKDEEKALYYYLKAADKEYVPAQISVSRLYEDRQEYKKAYEYMEKAMSQLFLNETDLEKRSPDLERLRKKMEDAVILEKEDSFVLEEGKEA